MRKCMGASRLDILRFISWHFARPVLIANLIAWPIAWFFMHRWLEGFAYHVNLNPMAFLLASALAVSIALATVCSRGLLPSLGRGRRWHCATSDGRCIRVSWTSQ